MRGAGSLSDNRVVLVFDPLSFTSGEGGGWEGGEWQRVRGISLVTFSICFAF